MKDHDESQQRKRNETKQQRDAEERDSKPRDLRLHPHHELVNIEPSLVQRLWEEAIDVDVTVDDPYFATSQDDYERRVYAAESTIAAAQKKRRNPYSFAREAFREAPYSEQKALEQLYRFESRMKEVQHSTCSQCHECSLNVVVTKRDSICERCRRKACAKSYTIENDMLPVWTDDEGQVHYEVPRELFELTIAEVLLIQRVAPLVPLVHIRNGTLGIKGHVCSFTQDINEVATTLPRLPSNVTAVKMVRTFVGSTGEPTIRTFIVNRHRVMRALMWLVRYHRDYKAAYENGELTIDASNLDWIGDKEEAELPSVATLERRFDNPREVDGEDDGKVSEAQAFNPENTPTDELECSGIIGEGETSLTSEAHDALIRSLKKTAEESERHVPVLDWPQTSTEPLSEFNDSCKIFTNAFPHLYPGGIGDVNDENRNKQVQVSDWAKHLLFYEDGRFARDPVWPFFAMNYVQRRRNVQSGNYFVDSHISNPPRCLEDLQEQLREGDTSFINKIMFYSKRVRGSDAYWRHKRSELYTWINHHLAAGNGPPHIFKTLSCAEYFWPDMIRLLEERVWIAEGRHVSGEGTLLYRSGEPINLADNKTARNKAVNDYSIVVQEFFIKRVEDWLRTVGRDVLGIAHFWVRFEFAKGRGQIHAHLLAILFKDIMARLQRQLSTENCTPQEEAKIIGDWADKMFKMTAQMQEGLASDTSATR